MRGKRSKQYRKLMQQYGLTFGFREPYQVLVDAEIIKDADRFKMDLVGGLERTLHGQVKPLITQCCMRHLYATSSEPGMSFVIDKAKLFERRRCGHRPEDYAEPLSAKECLASVVDPKDNKSNKNRYVVASQELEVRKKMRGVMGVPLVYINRSVMIMEPMASATVDTRDKGEKVKFRDGLKSRASGSQGMKRKREEDGTEEPASKMEQQAREEKAARKKAKYGLSTKKQPKKKAEVQAGAAVPSKSSTKGADAPVDSEAGNEEAAAVADGSEPNTKRKRRRKHKTAGEQAAGSDSIGGGEDTVGVADINE
ncbi:hypothetical protein PVAG01_11289 [Phlyctema vagabunda]|uniref:rRNA-processing protein UTP23 n=1 Tax=Phlyctema vagabunda TaxID=108571 RepID=A0ABR4P1W3_9HELO